MKTNIVIDISSLLYISGKILVLELNHAVKLNGVSQSNCRIL